MGGKRVCEVCGINESRRGGFFASFPLDENRCRAWVKLVGKKDLVFLPIEKLHKLRSVCGDHFEKRDFNKKGNRLKKRAYPKLNLLAAPLPDEVLREFPLHVASKTAPLHSGTSKQQNATIDEHILNVSASIEATPGTSQQQTTNVHTNLKRNIIDDAIENVTIKKKKSGIMNKSYQSIEVTDLNER
ncbi:unnamed protein product, partial [Brenthis ino]